MIPESMVNTFRDMSKNPDMHPVDPIERSEIKKMLKEDGLDFDEDNSQEKEPGKEKKEKILDPVSKAFDETVSLVASAELLPEFKENKKEQEIIEQRKKLILGYLKRVLEDVKNYLSQVNNWQIQNRSDNEADLEKYQELMGAVDEERRTCHNRLISDIALVGRLINVNFNANYPEELRLKEESKVMDRKDLSPKELKEVMSQRQYYSFPVAGGAFIDLRKASDPLTERKMIASWAFRIYSDLTTLETDLGADLESMKKAHV